MSEINMNTAELLQQLSDISVNIQNSIQNKGVVVSKGFANYSAAIDNISTGGGDPFDFSQVGWDEDNNAAVNEFIVGHIDDYISSSKQVALRWRDYLDWEIYGDFGRLPPEEFTDVVIAPQIINFEIDMGLAIKGLFQDDKKLVYVPAFDIHRTTSMSSWFRGCTNLEYVGDFDSSSVTAMSSLFYNCTALKYAPNLITSNVTTMSYMFYNCNRLEYIPDMDTGRVQNMNSMYYYCSRLKTLPNMDTRNVRFFNNFCEGCSSLETISQLDMSSVENADGAFLQCDNLVNVGGFMDLKCSMNLGHCRKLTKESLLNILNGLGTVEDASLTLSEESLSLLTEDDIAIATDKGWILN